MKKKLKNIIVAVFVGLMSLLGFCAPVSADSGITLSPMNTKILLTPGEVYKGSFIIANPAKNDEDYSYASSVLPFFVDDSYSLVFDKVGSYSQIVDWTTIDNPTGTLAPNSTAQINYTIDVPADAPAGGQYVAIKVGSVNSDTVGKENSINLDVTYGVAYIIYAEVAGTTYTKGEIFDLNAPSFLFDGNIKASSFVKNSGNVHGTATYKLQVFPLFSNEEVFTNEENAYRMTVLPERTYYNETVWGETPPMGIFNIVYTVEFEGVTQQLKKMVIKCPIWLLFIIIFVVVAIIIFIVMKVKGGKKAKRQ